MKDECKIEAGTQLLQSKYVQPPVADRSNGKENEQHMFSNILQRNVVSSHPGHEDGKRSVLSRSKSAAVAVIRAARPLARRDGETGSGNFNSSSQCDDDSLSSDLDYTYDNGHLGRRGGGTGALSDKQRRAQQRKKDKRKHVEGLVAQDMEEQIGMQMRACIPGKTNGGSKILKQNTRCKGKGKGRPKNGRRGNQVGKGISKGNQMGKRKKKR